MTELRTTSSVMADRSIAEITVTNRRTNATLTWVEEEGGPYAGGTFYGNDTLRRKTKSNLVCPTHPVPINPHESYTIGAAPYSLGDVAAAMLAAAGGFANLSASGYEAIRAEKARRFELEKTVIKGGLGSGAGLRTQS